MEFKHLRTVVAVAEAGSITKAAKILNIAQPALSNQLQQLEYLIGTELFVRTPMGVQLTEAGDRFLIHAKSMLKYSEQVITEMKSTSSDISGSFVIGCASSLAFAISEKLIKNLKHRFPKLTPTVLALGGPALQHSMVVGDLDLCLDTSEIKLSTDDGNVVFSAENKNIKSLQIEKITTERFLICRPSDTQNDLQSDKKIIEQELPVEFLETTPICMITQTHPVTKVVDWLAKEHNLQITHYGYTNKTEGMIDLVLSNECIALLPESIADLSLRRSQISLYPIRGYQIEREIVLYHSDDRALSEPNRMIKDVVVQVLRSTLANKNASAS